MPILTSIQTHAKLRIRPSLQLAMVLLFVSANTTAQDNTTEFQLKAVFIYNFLNFIEWPETAFGEPSDPFVIGVAGTNPFGTALEESVTGETYRGRRIEVRYIINVHQALECHMLYIEKNCEFFKEILASTKAKAILTIADTDDFMLKGGMIRFYLERNQLRMEINQQSASDGGLVVSAKLLRLAKVYNIK